MNLIRISTMQSCMWRMKTLGENVVAEELQKGYMYRDTVVRHSMVKVAN